MALSTPVLLITYNRPDHTRAALSRLQLLQPKRLYVFSDGSKERSDAQVTAVRKVISESSLPFKTKQVTNNLGCKKGVQTAIDWVLSQEERAIILEDDIEVHSSFFPFVEELLMRYENDTRVSMITAGNLVEHCSLPHSYGFSTHAAVWGWATWRRAWQQYHQVETLLAELSENAELQKRYVQVGNRKKIESALSCVQGKIDTWDFIWNATLSLTHSLCIFPEQNLVVNHGFQEDATHTRLKTKLSALRMSELKLPLHHPPALVIDAQYDQLVQQSHTPMSMLLQVLQYHVFRK